jgi:hypothetical protein
MGKDLSVSFPVDYVVNLEIREMVCGSWYAVTKAKQTSKD